MAKGTTSSYKLYLKTAKHPIVDLPTYRSVTNKYLQYLISELEDNGQVVLPIDLGKIAFEGKKITIKLDENGNIKGILPIDWYYTRLMWEEYPEKRKKEYVYYDNDHTNGVRYKFKWLKKGNKVMYKHFYTFIPARGLKRHFASLIKNREKEFIVYD